MSVLTSIPYVVILSTLIGLTALGLVVFSIPRTRLHLNHTAREGTRACRYCFFGRAQLLEQSAHVEGDDLVEVKLFACTSCGLPQWSVSRGPVMARYES